MTAVAHPFAVARNRSLDWRALLAPESLVTSGQDFSLVLETGARHPAPLTVQPWQDRTAAPWVLAYRSVPATKDLIAEDGTDQLTDRFGRALFLVEGVAVTGADDLPPDRAEALVDRVHDQAVAAFRDFWNCEDESYEPAASRPLDPTTDAGLVAPPPAGRRTSVAVAIDALLRSLRSRLAPYWRRPSPDRSDR